MSINSWLEPGASGASAELDIITTSNPSSPELSPPSAKVSNSALAASPICQNCPSLCSAIPIGESGCPLVRFTAVTFSIISSAAGGVGIGVSSITSLSSSPQPASNRPANTGAHNLSAFMLGLLLYCYSHFSYWIQPTVYCVV